MADKKFIFKTQYNFESEKNFSSSGNAIKKKYCLQIDEVGYEKLVPTGEENVYDYIQSFSKDCDINILIQRYKQTGDIRSLVVKNGFYGDVANMPDSLQGYYNLLKKGEKLFDQLSAEDKQKYNNNYLNFIMNFKEDIKDNKVDKVDNAVDNVENVKGGDNNE